MNCDSGSQQSDVKQEEVYQVKCEPDIEAEGNVKIEELDYQDIEDEIPQSEILPTTTFIPEDIEAEGNVKIEELDYQDIEEEIPQSEILPTTTFIPEDIKNDPLADEIETKDHLLAVEIVTKDTETEGDLEEKIPYSKILATSPAIPKMEITEDLENTFTKCFHNNGGEKDMRSTFCVHGNSGTLINEEQYENVGMTGTHNLDTHNMEKTLQSLKSFKCDVCMESFTQKSQLSQHSYTHTAEKPFKCIICLKSFSLRFHLTQHLYTHNGEKPFQCKICSKLFTKKNYMILHSYTHTAEKPFKCVQNRSLRKSK